MVISKIWLLRRSSHLVLVVLLLFATSCDKYTRFPQWSWSDIDCSTSKRWRVQTPEEAYLVRRFTTTDSTVVIEAFSDEHQSYRLDYRTDTLNASAYGVRKDFALPITLSFNQVTSIERVDKDYKMAGFVVLGVFAVVAILAWVLYGTNTTYK